MFITLLGNIGLGLVWGWLIGRLEDSVHRVLSSVLAVGISTLLLAAEIYLFSSWRGAFLFLGAVGLAWLLHLGWRRELRQRFDSLV